MSLRPSPASWFEMLVLRTELTTAIDVLAHSALVELQSHGESTAPLHMSECRELLAEFDDLKRRYGPYWPAALAHEPDERLEPYRTLENAMQRLHAWSHEAPGLIDQLESLRDELGDLRTIFAMLRDARPLPDLAAFEGAGPLLETRIFELPGREWPQALPSDVIVRRAETAEHSFLLGIGLPQDIAALEHQLILQKARSINLPAGLTGGVDEALATVEARIAAVDAAVSATLRDLEALHDRHDVADAIADAEFVRWYADNVPELSSTENFAWITGWTSDPNGQQLLRALASAGVKGLLRLQPPPPGFEPPLILHNPAWMRPFEIFSGMLGVPAADEVDPTRIVALTAPLIFGYMFGDIGQGAVLVIVGLTLSRHAPALRLLISGGAASIVFGWIFGTVFAREDIIEPLWLRPLESPVSILLLPMAGGVVLLLTGLLLDALQAYWQRRGRGWLETGAGLVICYLSLLAALLEPLLLWATVAGALWFVLGHALAPTRGQRLAAVGRGAAEILEILLQLVVNTISFVRVGAFSLAHAGLCVAVVGIADSPSSATVGLLLLVLGNILIIGLEGLVAGIQTTRLVLFEFFVRFLRAEGRPFKPISPRTTHRPEDHRRSS